jgi:hypothetical protein
MRPTQSNAIAPPPPPINSRIRENAHAAIGQLDYADLSRGAGTLHTYGNVRVDMQGHTSTHANIQAQVGGSTIAGTLVDHGLQSSDPANQRGIARGARSALEQSLDDGHMYHLNR